MTKSKFTMNLDKETRKELQHIAVDEERTVTEIVTDLIEQYIASDKTKKEYLDKSFNENDIEIQENGISLDGTFFDKKSIADTFNELIMLHNFIKSV